jgi:hypothetical protein
MFKVEGIETSIIVNKLALLEDSLLGLLYREDEGTVVLRIVYSSSLIDTA